MKRGLISGAVLAAAVTLAACGSSGSGGYGGSPRTTATAGAPGTVAVKQIDGVGNVLVASNGKALYSPDQEASGMILCTGACASIWTPLAAASGTPTAMPGVTLGVIDRPDGTKQVTADGKPLYTFSEDSAGKVTGNDVSDSFGSQHFTWHALLADGQTATSSGTTGTSTGGASPGYGY